MHGHNHVKKRRKRRPFAAAIAALLAFSLAFMAFDPAVLRSAFADNATAAQGEGVSEGDDGAAKDAAGQPVAATDEGEQSDTPLGDVQAEEGEAPASPDAEGDVASLPADGAEPAADANDIEARAGPADDGEASSTGEEASSVEASGEETTGEEAARERADTRADEVATCVVTFYGNVASANPAIIARKAASAQPGSLAVVSVSDVVASPPTGAQVFVGWSFGGEVRTDSIEVDPRSGDISLYPVFSSGHWLRFVEGEAGSGAVAVPSRFIAANDAAPTALPTTTRAGYAFEGWFTGSEEGGSIAYGERVADSTGAVDDPARLRDLLKDSDVTLFAKWTAAQTTYRVITWFENPDDEGYSFAGAETIGDDEGERAISGEMTGAREMDEVEGFELAHVEDKVIAGDGSTVVNATYDRREYSVYFHRGPSMDDALFEELTITAKYGADVSDQWPKPLASEEYTSSWHTLPNDNDTFVNGINTMPLGGAHFFVKTDKGMNFSIVFLVQDLTGGNEFVERRTMPFSARVAPDTTPDDYMPIKGFVVNAASEEDAAKIRAIPSGDKAATHDAAFDTSTPVRTGFKKLPVIADADGVERYTAHIRYLRCQYDIVFEENGGPELADIEDVYYEAPLSGLAPASYVAGETTFVKPDGQTFVFAGWYANDALAGDGFDFETAEMPANNLVLYAKWEPVRYLVQIDPAGGEFENPAQSTYFWVGHGDQVPSIGVARDYVADPDGAYAYVYERQAGDADGFGEARYVEAQPGYEGERYRRDGGAYTLYGWYRIVDGAPVPYDFSEGVTSDIEIQARWRAAGTFDIAYNATADVEGTTVTGDIDVPLDAGYSDLSATYVMNAPTGIRAESGETFRFVGWKVVDGFGANASVLVDGIFLAGDAFIVDSALARGNTIHLQAVYVRVIDGGEGEAIPEGPENPVVRPQGGTPAGDAPGATGGTSGSREDAKPAASSAGSSQAPASASSLPQTGDLIACVPLALAGVAFIGLAIALIAFTGRRRDNR